MNFNLNKSKTDSSELIWITPKWPLPADDGAKQANTQLIHNLALQGQVIHFCPLITKHELEIDFERAKRDLAVTDVTPIIRPSTTVLRRFLHLLSNPFTALTLAPFAEREVANQIRNVIDRFPDALVVHDGLHCAGWTLRRLEKDARTRPTLIYRAHNVESALWESAAKERPWSSPFGWFLRFQKILMERFERKVAQDSFRVFPVSDVDARIFRSWISESRVITLPIGMATAAVRSEEEVDGSRPLRLLFVGKLDWAPNRDGLLWFLREVWPEVCRVRADIELTIVGSGIPSATLAEKFKMPRVNFLGRVDSLVPHYQACDVTLVPIFYGSGTRVKAIESCIHEKPCLSTALGVEGLDLSGDTHYFRAEDAREWIDTLVSLSNLETAERGKKACLHIRDRFDPVKIARKFGESLRAVPGTEPAVHP
ncbi:MAG: glycosyltransferase [Methylotenera sp.]|nr:glycosyltransferase [Oligoflexia bacterium]